MTMQSLIAHFFRNLVAGPFAPNTGHRAAVAGGIPHHLLEGAEARAGQCPHQAAELRQAASAYLRVVR